MLRVFCLITALTFLGCTVTGIPLDKKLAELTDEEAMQACRGMVKLRQDSFVMDQVEQLQCNLVGLEGLGDETCEEKITDCMSQEFNEADFQLYDGFCNDWKALDWEDCEDSTIEDWEDCLLEIQKVTKVTLLTDFACSEETRDTYDSKINGITSCRILRDINANCFPKDSLWVD